MYDEYAGQWDDQRPRQLYERKWLERFCDGISGVGSVLDLGCGAGEPVQQFLIERGYELTGVDFSRSMIGLAASRFPDHSWLVQDMREIQIERCFDGIVSWDGLFHLSQSEQRQLFNRLPDLLHEKAVLLFTIGTGDGEVTGTVAGQTVYHASLSSDEYRSIIQDMGFTNIDIILEDDDVLGRSILFATR